MRGARQRAWLIYLAAVAAGFAVLEAVAYRTGSPPTLSRCTQRWLGVHPRRQRLFWAAVGALTAASPIYTLHVLRLDKPEEPPPCGTAEPTGLISPRGSSRPVLVRSWRSSAAIWPTCGR